MFQLNGVKFNVLRHGRTVYSIIADCGGPKETMKIFNFCKNIFKEKRNNFYVDFLTDRRMAKAEYVHRHILDCLRNDFKEQIENGIVQISNKGPEIHIWLKSQEGCFVFNPDKEKYPKSFEEFRSCLIGKKELREIKNVSKLDEGVKGYISGELSYKQGVKYPLTPENVTAVHKSHDTLKEKYGKKGESG